MTLDKLAIEMFDHGTRLRLEAKGRADAKRDAFAPPLTDNTHDPYQSRLVTQVANHVYELAYRKRRLRLQRVKS